MTDAIENFLQEVAASLASDSFVKLVLSNYKGADRHLQKIAVRVIETKRGRFLSFQNHFETRQTVKTYSFDESILVVRRRLMDGFRNAHLFTTTADFQLKLGKKAAHIVKGKPTFREKPSPVHDRAKKTLVNPNASYLKALGITNDKGEVRTQQRDKWRQINKYVEVLRDLVNGSSLKEQRSLKIVDMGSGKGYLTFAAYDYFANERALDVEMTGVESRGELVRFCNQVATAVGFGELSFVSGSIDDFMVDNVDILIALHACDTATDDALFKGIAAKAEIIVAAPCCHKEIRRQMKAPEILKDILKHGSILEREAETVTDGLRAMLLQRSGYSARIFEFVPTEHTPKNNLLVAIRAKRRKRDHDEDLQGRINAVKSFYGITGQRLENLLA